MLRFFAYLRNTMFAGLLVVAPLAVTGFVAWNAVIFLDEFVAIWLPARIVEDWRIFGMPGMGAVIAILLLVLIGSLVRGVLVSWFHRVISWILNYLPVPLLGTIYGTLRQLLETIFSDKSVAFREVVLVEYPRKGIYALGFVSGEAHKTCQHKEGRTLINVFVPTTPNPTSGFLLLFDCEDLIKLDLSVEDGIKMVVSSGLVSPDDKLREQVKANKDKA